MKQESAIKFIEPMMALRVRELPVGNWLYEMKFDGYRALVFNEGAEIRLLSRNRTLFNDNYPVLVEALKSLKAKNFIIVKSACKIGIGSSANE
jgi:bifunctional non-homologous end joining protein LigD